MEKEGDAEDKVKIRGSKRNRKRRRMGGEIVMRGRRREGSRREEKERENEREAERGVGARRRRGKHSHFRFSEVSSQQATRPSLLYQEGKASLW